MDAETRKAAIDTVARYALAREVKLASIAGRIDWADYPDLDEADWGAVLSRVDAIALSIMPNAQQYCAAYRHLTGQEGQAL